VMEVERPRGAVDTEAAGDTAAVGAAVGGDEGRE
jgi:hypothetical protein